ncbi:IDEAL domain-containing protein [Bacillus sp. FJAT-50079]|uniref:IDEAL domain-containing protein n=1 Tax=Bacillus sp. FJAT-50079 TaxID=2833577 RepID=UPI001BCA5AEB|nr:IDEAL domain-containing protein [Bacillus sp. FJAT-50079]MBS4207105.1 IDEAL domain-containing protein [Bacillus sp. FJAT-50079]
MIQHFIAKETFTHQIECFCPGNIHSTSLTINKMDILEVREQSFTFNNGWYVQAIINNHGCFYIALEDLDQYFYQGKLMSVFDLELDLNYLQLQIDKALVKRDEELFLKSTKQLKEATALKMQIENFLNNEFGSYYLQ